MLSSGSPEFQPQHATCLCRGLSHRMLRPQCCLTPRSRRGPTSKRQARAVGGRIFHCAGLAFCCRSRLSSNVRQHTGHAVAAPAVSAAQSAVSLNSHDAAKPRNTVSTLPGLKQWLASEATEYQRRSPHLVLHLHRVPAEEEARSYAAGSREFQFQGRRQSIRQPAATGVAATSSAASVAAR